MARRFRGVGLLLPLLAAALALGVGEAGGSALAITTVQIEVIGNGNVKSDFGGIDCGNGATSCFRQFSGTGTVTLTATPGGSFSNWGGPGDAPDCTGSVSTVCTIPLDGTEHQVTANFGTGAPRTLSVTVSDGGSVKGGAINCGTVVGPPQCTWTVLAGSTLTVRAIPEPGFVFDGWTGPCAGANLNVVCTVELLANESVEAAFVPSTVATFTLTVTISGAGTVAGGGLDCFGPAVCTKELPADTTVTLTATAFTGYTFTGWSGACVGSGFHCTLTMSAARSVTATFAPGVNLTVSVTGNGNVSSGNGVINCGNGGTVCTATIAVSTTITLVATASTGATFSGWSGACGGSATTCTILMNQAKGVTATFSGGAAATFALTVSVAGNGRVTGGGISCGNGGTTCSANQAANVTVTLTAVPATGASFSSWGGSCTGTSTTCTVVMTAARSVTATFAGGTTTTTTFLLSVSVSGQGTVTGGAINCGRGGSACSANATADSTITLLATPVTGARFLSWGGACTGASPTCSVVMNAAKSVTATFTAVAAAVALTVRVVGRGSVAAPAGTCASSGGAKTCRQSYTAGTSAVLVATPQQGAAFLGWGGACTGKNRTCVVRLTEARSVTATFSAAAGVVTGAVIQSTGRPTVTRGTSGFFVTLHIGTTRAGVIRVRGLRAGRAVTALRFRVLAGPGTIGPFPVALPGFYIFEITLTASGRTYAIETRACLGSCGAAAPSSAGSFVVTREGLTIKRAGAAWLVTVRFHETRPSGVNVRVFRRTTLVADLDFAPGAGSVALGPLVLAPGDYTIRLTAVDAFGRVRSLKFVALLSR